MAGGVVFCYLLFSDNFFSMRYLYTLFFCIFFFQAEDGIRDLVRSRGLGDVYKRQTQMLPLVALRLSRLMQPIQPQSLSPLPVCRIPVLVKTTMPVSYTHLTLPTSDLV